VVSKLFGVDLGTDDFAGYKLSTGLYTQPHPASLYPMAELIHAKSMHHMKF
jgi:hypothetical protein